MAGWGGYNLPAIWTMIERENACTGADRVLNWQGLAEAVREQHRRLQKARGELAAVWPPETNASARDFLEKVDLLAAHMEHTLTAAENTRVGLQGVIEALGTAQSTIRPLIEERAAAADDLVPRFVDHAEDKYDERAQRAMAEAEKAIAEHSAQIQAPVLYRLERGQGSNDNDLGTTRSAGSGSAGPPSVGSDGAPAGGSDGAVVQARPVPVAIPEEVPPSLAGLGSPPDGGAGHSPGLGPGLASAAPLPPAMPVGGPAPIGVLPPGMPSATANLPGMMPVIGGMGTAVGAVVPGALGALPGRNTSAQRRVPVGRAMPSGAVIGPTNSPPGSTGRGVVGQMMPAPTGRASDSATERTIRGGAADETWGVDRGVAPVIEPDTTPAYHDPGPNVIGWPR